MGSCSLPPRFDYEISFRMDRWHCSRFEWEVVACLLGLIMKCHSILIDGTAVGLSGKL